LDKIHTNYTKSRESHTNLMDFIWI